MSIWPSYDRLSGAEKREFREREGERFRAARIRAGLSITEVEQRLGMAPTRTGGSYLREVEDGRVLLLDRFRGPLRALLGIAGQQRLEQTQ